MFPPLPAAGTELELDEDAGVLDKATPDVVPATEDELVEVNKCIGLNRSKIRK